MSTAELAAITGLPEANAASLLAAHGGDANAALSAHLDTLDASGSASPGPGAEDSTTSVTDKLFAKAREAGPPREDPADAVTPAFVPFGGAGRSLSKDSTPDTAKSSSSSGGGGAKENESAAEEERIVKIKLGFFRNGFLVDDDHFFKSSGAEYDTILKVKAALLTCSFSAPLARSLPLSPSLPPLSLPLALPLALARARALSFY